MKQADKLVFTFKFSFCPPLPPTPENTNDIYLISQPRNVFIRLNVFTKYENKLQSLLFRLRREKVGTYIDERA